MVLSELNNHEHRTKQTYESYTFQPLMSFWLHTADKNPRRVELSSSVLLQTLGKLKSLQGTEVSVVVVICLLGSF